MFNYKIDGETYLRLLEPRDARQFFDLVSSNMAHIGGWMFWLRDDYSPQDAERHIKASLDRFAAGNGLEAGIWSRGALAGDIRLSHIDWTHRSTEIGYWLGASFQGRGLVTRACRAMIDYAFKELVLNRVEIRCTEENQRSRRIPERLMFKQEGVIRQARWKKDHFVDHIVYGMLASEWLQEEKE
ncbi:MAG TPA: GNAT family protein [Blastocatellia bacterium]|nr:GNAT family protein [Blastocatellia bacterium]